jgi:hypothetical protein
MKSYYQAHKDKIRKGGTPEAYNYEKMFRDTLGGISKSKTATAKAETFNKIRLERQKVGRSTPEDWFNEYTQHEDTSIWDEKFPDLDISKFMANQALKYDPQKTLKGFADIKRTPGSPRYEQDPSDRFARLEYIDETFDPNAKTTIVARAQDLYDTDDAFAMEVQKDFNNPIKRGELDKIAQKEFGTAPQSMSDYAAAKILEQLQPTVTGKPKRVLNREEMMKQQHKNALSRLYTYAGIQQGKEDQNELLAIRELKSYINQAAGKGGEFTPRQEIINGLSIGTGILKQSPNKFILSPDGTTVTYSGNGLQPRSVTVEAFFNDITNALPTKDKGTKAQEVIDKAKKKPTTRPPLNSFIKNK